MNLSSPLEFTLLMTHLIVSPVVGIQLARIIGVSWWIGPLVTVLTSGLGTAVLTVWALVVSFVRLGEELQVKPPRQAFEGRSDLAFNTLGKLLAAIGPIVYIIPIVLIHWLPWHADGILNEDDQRFLIGFGSLFLAFALICALCAAPRWANLFTLNVCNLAFFETFFELKDSGASNMGAGFWVLFISTIVMWLGCLIFAIMMKGPQKRQEQPPVVQHNQPQAVPAMAGGAGGPGHMGPGNVGPGSAGPGYGPGPGGPGPAGPGTTGPGTAGPGYGSSPGYGSGPGYGQQGY
ncbi:hypothetical protein [Brevibacterium paucivorans]|nr:hypothetical protein [Brevibacterium paucivorans]